MIIISGNFIFLFNLLFTKFTYWSSGDKLGGEANRLLVAEAYIQALEIEFTEGKAYEHNRTCCSSFKGA